MWLITPFGFFSIVEKTEDQNAGTLTVRSRVLCDLLTLKQTWLPSLDAITEDAGTDYRYRARAPKADVATAMAQITRAIDYSNFEDQVARHQGEQRAHLYHQLRDVLQQWQEDPGCEQPGIPETIVKIGADDGYIELSGIRKDGSWTFRLSTGDADASDQTGLQPISSWAAALEQLDRYPWTMLFPLEVHPLFRASVRAALVSRLGEDGVFFLEQWESTLGQ